MRLCQVERPLQGRVWRQFKLTSHFWVWVCIAFCEVRHMCECHQTRLLSLLLTANNIVIPQIFKTIRLEKLKLNWKKPRTADVLRGFLCIWQKSPVRCSSLEIFSPSCKHYRPGLNAPEWHLNVIIELVWSLKAIKTWGKNCDITKIVKCFSHLQNQLEMSSWNRCWKI